MLAPTHLLRINAQRYLSSELKYSLVSESFNFELTTFLILLQIIQLSTTTVRFGTSPRWFHNKPTRIAAELLSYSYFICHSLFIWL